MTATHDHDDDDDDDDDDVRNDDGNHGADYARQLTLMIL